MISNNTFSDLSRKHMMNLIDEVEKNGSASAKQWTEQLGNIVISMIMTCSDKIPLPRKQTVNDLTSEVIVEIVRQNKWQLDNDNKGLE